MTRLNKIASFISDDEKVLDVGCDMAHLSVILAKRKIYSIASDLRENIIKNAKDKVDDNLKEYITFRVCDGISLNNEEKNYTLVLSGMGTYTILKILKATNERFNKIIISSNNNLDILRKEMLKINYVIDYEEIIKERNKYYDIIVFKNGVDSYTSKEILLGKNHKNNEMYKQRNIELYNKYKNIVKNNPIKEIEEKIKILETEI